MAKFAIGEQVENAVNDRESGMVVAVFPTVDGSFDMPSTPKVTAHSQFFAEEKLALAVTRQGVT